MHNQKLDKHFGPTRNLENLLSLADARGHDVYSDYPDEPGWEVLDLVHVDDLDTTTEAGKARYRRYAEATEGVFGVTLPADDDEVPEGHVMVIGRTNRYTETIPEEKAAGIVDDLVEESAESEEAPEPEPVYPGIREEDILRTHKVQTAAGKTVTWLVLRGGEEQDDA